MILKEAADQLGVTPDNLRGAIARGSLHAVKVGRDWHVAPWEVERYRRAHLRTTTPYVGLSYPIVFNMWVNEDGKVGIGAMADVSREGSGPYGSGETVEEAVGQLIQGMREKAEPWSDIVIPEVDID